MIWLAVQGGEYDGLDHDAFAGVFELGYPRVDWPLAPWFRVGVNAASGDDDSTDRDHGTFFNQLPTNHLYHGFADHLAFQNLLDSFVQLRLFPRDGLTVDLFVHRFSLMHDEDGRYFGTGAFNRSAFGFGVQPSQGLHNIGTEIDAVVGWKLPHGFQLSGGYAWLKGGALLAPRASRRDVHFAYLQLSAEY